MSEGEAMLEMLSKEDPNITPVQKAARARALRDTRAKILKAVNARLAADIKEYIKLNEAKIIFTISQGGGFSLGIDVYLPDGGSVTEAMQKATAPTDAPTDPAPSAIEIVSR